MTADIEDRTRSQQSLHARWSLERAHHFRSIVDSIQPHVGHLTSAGVVEDVNYPALEYFGATLNELKGLEITDIVHPDDLPDVLAAWTIAVENGHPYDVEGRFRSADGVYRWFHTHTHTRLRLARCRRAHRLLAPLAN